MHNRALRSAVPIATLIAALALAAPAWASTVQIQDDAHVLNATAVQNEAATLPVGVYVWATTQDAANKSAFDTDVRNKVNATFPVVIGINTQSRHESIQIGSQAGIPQNAALSAEASANSAFLSTIQSSHDYTTAVTAALHNLRTGLAGAHRGGPAGRRVVAHSSGGGFLLPLLIIAAMAAIAILVLRRRRSGSRMGPSMGPSMGPAMGGGPPMGYYPDYGPSYRSGMSPGAAGALGAVGGGLLGYELGKMEGEGQQFRQDEMMRGGQYDSPDQGNWVVGQDSDFGSAGDGGGGSDGGGGPGGGSGGDW